MSARGDARRKLLSVHEVSPNERLHLSIDHGRDEARLDVRAYTRVSVMTQTFMPTARGLTLTLADLDWLIDELSVARADLAAARSGRGR